MDINEFVRLKESHTEGPPSVWFIPIYGEGLNTTGSGNPEEGNGERYGYCYRPHLHIPSFDMFTSEGSSRLGKYLGPDRVKSIDPRYAEWLSHPYFATREEAVAWIKAVQVQVANFTDADRKFYNFPNTTISGEVVRYEHDRPIENRGPTWGLALIGNGGEWHQYIPPWWTGVITDRVLSEPDRIVSPRFLSPDPVILHLPDGTTRPL